MSVMNYRARATPACALLYRDDSVTTPRLFGSVVACYAR